MKYISGKRFSEALNNPKGYDATFGPEKYEECECGRRKKRGEALCWVCFEERPR